MLLSIKQRGFYMLPALPWFAFAISTWALSILMAFPRKNLLWLRAFCVVGIVAVFAYSVYIWGSVGRERAYVAFAKRLERSLPAGGQVCVCQAERMNYALEAYLQRYAHFTLTHDCTKAKAAIFRPEDCTEVSRKTGTHYQMEQWVLEIFE
jgi:hypothetical protein